MGRLYVFRKDEKTEWQEEKGIIDIEVNEENLEYMRLHSNRLEFEQTWYALLKRRKEKSRFGIRKWR